MIISTRTCGLVFFVAVLAVACDRSARRAWEPPAPQLSTDFLQQQTAEILRLVRDSRDRIRSEPAKAEDQLQWAVGFVERLDGFYLPLLEARERAYDAMDALEDGDTAQAIRQLDHVARILGNIVDTGDRVWLDELTDPLDLVKEATEALAGGSRRAPEALPELALKLNGLLLEGGLPDPQSWPTDDARE